MTRFLTFYSSEISVVKSTFLCLSPGLEPGHPRAPSPYEPRDDIGYLRVNTTRGDLFFLQIRFFAQTEILW